MPKQSVSEFARDVRREVSKVTWPSRKETTITTAMVFVMVLLAAIFFLVADQAIGWTLRAIFNLGA